MAEIRVRPLVPRGHGLSDGPECCCNCRWHVADHHHPIVDGESIIDRKGWVCLAPEFDEVFSGWPYHGLCEMWTADPRMFVEAEDIDGGPSDG
jgi:hypothetical protein